MADQDSFLDTAGGRQQVPDVDIVKKPEQPYLTPAGSMQNALAVNVLSGGVPADGVPLTDGETVDVLSSDGSTQLATGTADIDTSTDPNTLKGIDLPATDAVIPDGTSIPVQESDGTAIGNGTLNVTANQETHFTYDGGGSGTPLADGDSVNIDSADGNTILTTGTASVTNGNLVGVLTPGTVAVEKDGATATITAADGTTQDATVAVAANAATYTLPGTAAFAIHGSTYPLTNRTGSARGNVTASVAAGVLSLGLPTGTDTAVDQQSYDVLSADGNTTLASAPADVPESVFHGLLLPGDHAVVPDGGTVALQDSGGNSLNNGTGAAAANQLVVTVPDSVTGGGNSPSPGDDVGVWNAANDSRMFIGTANYSTGPLKVDAPDTVAALHDSGAVSLQNSAGDARGVLDVHVSGNNGILQLKEKVDTVDDQASLKLFYSNGDDTGETVAAKVPTASLTGVQINQAYTIVGGLDWVTVVNTTNGDVPGAQSFQALADLTDDGRLKHVGLDSTVTMVENQQQIVCELDGVQKQLTFSIADGVITGVTSADPPA